MFTSLQSSLPPSLKLLFGAVAAAGLVGCGGGSSTTTTATPVAATPVAATPVVTGTVPSPTSTATATLASTQTEAAALVTEAKAGLSAAASASVGAGFRGPLGVEASALPSGITQVLQCSTLGTGGSGSIDYDVPATQPAAGYTMTFTYKACAFDGYTFNGVFKMVYDRYVSPTDFGYTFDYQNFTVSGLGVTDQSFSGKTSCNIAAGNTSCYYNDGTRGWSSSMKYSAGTVNGSYAVNYGNGSVQVTYTNFGAFGGTATVTGANGSKAVITRNSASSFTVSITTATGVTASVYTVTL